MGNKKPEYIWRLTSPGSTHPGSQQPLKLPCASARGPKPPAKMHCKTSWWGSWSSRTDPSLQLPGDTPPPFPLPQLKGIYFFILGTAFPDSIGHRQSQDVFAQALCTSEARGDVSETRYVSGAQKSQGFKPLWNSQSAIV